MQLSGAVVILAVENPCLQAEGWERGSLALAPLGEVGTQAG